MMKKSENDTNKNSNSIEFKCCYGKYFEYVPLSEIEKYIEFDLFVVSKINI